MPFDEEYERLNPYYGICSKHGLWRGSYDECPKCMEDEYRNEQDNIPNSICWDCCYCDEEPASTIQCQYNPKLKRLHQIPRKKQCKHFKQMLHYDCHGEL